jgi:hypothetical protein
MMCTCVVAAVWADAGVVSGKRLFRGNVDSTAGRFCCGELPPG